MSNVFIDIKDVTIYTQQDNRRGYRSSNIILSDIDLEIREGELVYFIGKVGSGKSSLLKTLYAEFPLQQGEIEIGNFNLSTLKYRQIPMLRRSLGLVFQDFQLLPDRTVFENLRFFLRSIGWKESEKINNRIIKVLKMVGLESKVKKFPYQLSGGEQQRLSIGRALLNRPRIILADEPTGNLDPICTEEIMDIFQSIANSGCAVVIATHDLNVMDKYPGRTILFNNQTVKEVVL
ncbi:MAG: ATP-binding cassette domain-containing protein [Rikenellaceae bacterium]